MGRAPQLSDIEVVRHDELMWNIASFHTLDVCLRRSLREHARQLLERLRRPRRDHLHGAVPQVAYEAPQSPPLRLAQHEPAESHSLHPAVDERSEEHTSELQSLAYLVCRLLLEKN